MTRVRPWWRRILALFARPREGPPPLEQVARRTWARQAPLPGMPAVDLLELLETG